VVSVSEGIVLYVGSFSCGIELPLNNPRCRRAVLIERQEDEVLPLRVRISPALLVLPIF
jgi:hypothetical protein